jgi:hypothetical protein
MREMEEIYNHRLRSRETLRKLLWPTTSDTHTIGTHDSTLKKSPRLKTRAAKMVEDPQGRENETRASHWRQTEKIPEMPTIRLAQVLTPQRALPLWVY